MRRSRIVVLFVVALAQPLVAQDRGVIGIAAVGENTSGNEASFRSQNDLRSGFVLEELFLRYGASELRANGFGNAEPWQRAAFRFAGASPWTFALDYDRRRSFFALTNPDFALHSDAWHVGRWRAAGAYDGWAPARLGLTLRHTTRGGRETLPLFNLNEPYLLGRSLDDTMNEASFSIETRTLPVHLAFEQAYTRFEQRDSRAPDSPNAVGGDPDLFTAATSSRSDRERYPTSRLTATWGNERLAFAGTALYSPAKLRGSGTIASSFDINGGSAGRVQFIDDAISSASRDVSAAKLRFVWRAAPRWTVRLLTDTHRSSTDATLLGTHLIHATNPAGGTTDLTSAIDERTTFDVNDDLARLEVENGGEHYSIWAAAFTGRRNVDWNLPLSTTHVDRNTNGGALGGALRLGRSRFDAELEHGSFERYVFRTDPETTNRLTLRVQSGILHAQGRFERATNPDVNHRADALVLGAAWTHFGVDFDRTRIHTTTSLVLPVYDVNVFTTTAWARRDIGRYRISASAARVSDRGETFPLVSWNARLRAGYALRDDLEVALFGEKWSYDERRLAFDDYDVTRYGAALRWRIR